MDGDFQTISRMAPRPFCDETVKKTDKITLPAWLVANHSLNLFLGPLSTLSVKVSFPRSESRRSVTSYDVFSLSKVHG